MFLWCLLMLAMEKPVSLTLDIACQQLASLWQSSSYKKITLLLLSPLAVIQTSRVLFLLWFVLGFWGGVFFRAKWEGWLDKTCTLRSKEGSWLCKAMSWYPEEQIFCRRSARSFFSVTYSKVHGVLSHRCRLQRLSPPSVCFTSLSWRLLTPWRVLTPLYA